MNDIFDQVKRSQQVKGQRSKVKGQSFDFDHLTNPS